MTNKAYQQVGDYIPRKDEVFLSWAGAFAEGVAKNPAHLGLTAQDVQTIALWAKRYAEVYWPTQNAKDRSPSAVQAKKDVRHEAEKVFRTYAQLIKHYPGVTFQDMVELGIHVDDLTKTQIGPPETAPMLGVTLAKQGRHVLRYRDETTPKRKSKPANAALIQIYAHVGEAINVNVNDAVELGTWGRQPIRIDWPPSKAGLTVTYFGRWVTKKGLKGPWSLPKYMMVAVGGDAMTAVKGRGASREELRIAA